MSKINWAEIEMAFINGSQSLKEISEYFGVGYANVRKKAAECGWQEKRNNSSQFVTEKAQKIVEDIRALQLAEFTQKDLDRVSELQDEMKKLIPLIEKPSDLKAITGALLDLQKCYRLALGASTENQAVGNSQDFASWLEEKENGKQHD